MSYGDECSGENEAGVVVGGGKGRMGEIREGFVEKMVFRQRARESASHQVCAVRVFWVEGTATAAPSTNVLGVFQAQ